MIDPSLNNLFTDPAWCKFAPQLTKNIGAYPNAIYYNASANAVAVVAFRGQHETWALNQSSENYVFTAERDAKIAAGHAVLAAGKPLLVMASKPIAEVHAQLAGVPARDGDFGKYWWVDQEFKTDQPQALTYAPF
jgi:hypothetical protein